MRDSILARLAYGNREHDRYGHYADAREYLSEREDWRMVGERFGSALSKRVEESERECEDVRAKQDDLRRFESVKEVMRRHHISAWGPDGGAQRLDDALSKRGVSADVIGLRADYAIADLNGLLAAAGLPEYKQDALEA